MYEKDLVSFGMSEKEAKLYLALLELETATASEIAEKCGINRSTTYVLLENLEEKGFVGLSENDGKKRYIASSPDTFLRMAKEDLQTSKLLLERIEDIAPSLKALYSGTKKKPLVQVFEGAEGFKNALEEMLLSKEKVMRVTSSSELIMKNFSDFMIDYGARRFSAGVMMHCILPDTIYSKQLIESCAKLYKVAYIKDKPLLFSADVAIYDNRIGYMFPYNKSIVTIFIESSEIASVMKGLFDIAWQEASREGKTSGDLM